MQKRLLATSLPRMLVMDSASPREGVQQGQRVSQRRAHLQLRGQAVFDVKLRNSRKEDCMRETSMRDCRFDQKLETRARSDSGNRSLGA